MRKLIFVVLAIWPIVLFGQEKTDNKWAFGFSNGIDRSTVTAEKSVINTAVDDFYIDRFEYFWLRPEIRLNTNSGFWSLRLDDFNTGDTYSRNGRSQNGFIIYANMGLTISANKLLKQWDKAALMIGANLGYNYHSFQTRVYQGFEEEQRHTAVVGFIPRLNYSISKHFQLELAAEIRATEYAVVNEMFRSAYTQFVDYQNYRYLMILNGYSANFNLVYKL